MCLITQVVCPGCGLVVEKTYQDCFRRELLLQEHTISQQNKTIQSPDLLWWSCPSVDCDLNRTLHWSLVSLHATAIGEGKAYSQSHTYATLAVDDEDDEACELALSPEDTGVPNPPHPGFFSAEARLTARKMIQKGATHREIADAVDSSTASVGRYIAAYIRPNLKAFMEGYKPPSMVIASAPPRVQVEYDDDDESSSEEEDEEDDDESLPDIPLTTTKPVRGAPRPNWLSTKERRLVYAMRSRGETKLDISKALCKPRAQVVKYINAYIMIQQQVAASPIPGPAKRKRSEEEPQAEPGRSKRVRGNNTAEILDSIVVLGG
ncbi:hypothetical protein VP1G_09786 [Cytospora mali]|uniref:Uncharacterized protein n=1 Tax=Cytospora mali TaxID=578113 RepID=A0A194VFL4_CYTMA|nr:hypothetical protein VP1G_09786 [Valsa mali var. pyri (nom. inval.)]